MRKSPCCQKDFAQFSCASRFALRWDNPGGEFQSREAGGIVIPKAALPMFLDRHEILSFSQLSLPDEAAEKNFHCRS
jgi:hypothetical protein